MNLHIWQLKTIVLQALHVRFPFCTFHSRSGPIKDMRWPVFPLIICRQLHEKTKDSFFPLLLSKWSIPIKFQDSKYISGSLSSNGNGNENITWKLTFRKCWLFSDYCFFLASFIVDRARCKWTGRSAVEVNIENERFTVVCSRCR